jgi:hypothetical protein
MLADLGVVRPSNSFAAIDSEIKHSSKFNHKIKLPHSMLRVPSEDVPIVNITQGPTHDTLAGHPTVKEVHDQPATYRKR